eukprot:CAMPEP_0173136430 /NCGR_PEP_ID=MMETSP1105-20130129/2478_1 /TAXON_ID=2985 /ORGANISM="Ochromonas sp., Strain BG-1" /LENGTH=793 /DNA_ID=CAMNT_0014048609 /DNA_START=96 /DNA_END=2477 /DNA_ORIENTATION=-
MSGLDLQTLNILPRAGDDPRVAKTDEGHLTIGEDGKLYRMEDRRNWGKYHTLTEEEIQEEIRRSQEVRKNMLTMTGKMKNGKIVQKANKHAVSVTSPQFGVTTKSRRIEQKAWEKELQSANHTGKTLGDSRFGGTVDQLLANTKPETSPEEAEASEVYDYGDVENEDTMERKALKVIQKKYEQNLNVVEKLFHEKLSLEEYTKQLESQLEALTGKKIEHPVFDQAAPPSYDDVSSHPQLKRSQFDPTVAISATELADLLSHVGEADQVRGRARVPRSASSDQAMFVRSHSAPRGGAYDTPTRKTMSMDDPAYYGKMTRSRSSERSFSSRKVDGPSPHLQADIDRYVQKRRLMEERERLQRLEQQQYEMNIQQKRMQASLKGEEFIAMKLREEETKRKVEARLKKLENDAKKEEIQRKEREMEERKKKLDKLKQELQTRSTMTWEEIQQEDERNRQERRERRKNELLSMSSLPKSIEENLRKTMTAKKFSPIKESHNNGSHFKAEDIEKVREKLRKSLEKKEEMDERQRERSRERSRSRERTSISAGGSRASLGGGGGSGEASVLSSREQREKERKERWDAFKQAQKDKEEHKKEMEKQKEKLKYEKLLSAKLPDNALKLTKAEILKQQRVQQMKLQDERRRQMEAKKRAEKDMSLKETAAMVSLVLKERDEKLKVKNPGYVELTDVTKMVAERSKQAREEYQKKLQDNQRKYNEVKKNRPSLIMREDEKNAKKKAKLQAESKIANAILGAGDDDLYGDDFDHNPHGSDSDDDSLLGGKKKDKGKEKKKRFSQS